MASTRRKSIDPWGFADEAPSGVQVQSSLVRESRAEDEPFSANDNKIGNQILRFVFSNL